MPKDDNILSESEVSGLYWIQNKITGKTYIGQAENIRKRLIYHRAQLRKGKHKNPYLQASYNKHGEEAFEFKGIHEGYINLKVLEDIWIDAFKAKNKSYNMLSAVTSRLGTKQSDEAKAKLSKANKGRIITWGDKISEAKRGVPQSEEHIAKLSAVRKGRAAHNRQAVSIVNTSGETVHYASEGTFCLSIGRSWSYAYMRRKKANMTHQQMYDLAVAEGLVNP